MKNSICKANQIIPILLIVFICLTCTKDDTNNPLVKSGNWLGADIYFTVGGNPLKVSDLDFVYSYTSCSVNHESMASFAEVCDITGNTFDADINIYSISGTFVTDTTAIIQISWSGFDSDCSADYSGSESYTATYHSSR